MRLMFPVDFLGSSSRVRILSEKNISYIEGVY